MKKRNVFVYTLLTLFLGAGCSTSSQEILENTTSPSSGNVQVTLEDALNANIHNEASRYYGLLEQAFLATESNLATTRAAEKDNPFVQQLDALVIESDWDANDLSFYDLAEPVQLEFLDSWKQIESKEMSDKLAVVPYLDEHVKALSDVLEETLAEEGVMTRSGLRVKNNAAFFAKLKAKCVAQATDIAADASFQPETRGTASLEAEGTVDLAHFREVLRTKAQVGDILLSLPKFAKPWIMLNMRMGVYPIGHSAVVSRIPGSEPWVDHHESYSYGSLIGEGVVHEKHAIWSAKSYLLGLQTTKWDSRARKKVKVPVSNPERLATGVSKHLGKPYVKFYEFATAKWAAPKRFTCTVLLWHTAKKEFNIDISYWWAPLVSPSAIFLSDHTYVKAEITD